VHNLMKQRFGNVRTPLRDPWVLIHDDGASGVICKRELQAGIEMRTILLRLNDLSRTLIVTSDLPPELSAICEQMAIVIGGRLRAFGMVREVMHGVTSGERLRLNVHEQSCHST